MTPAEADPAETPVTGCLSSVESGEDGSLVLTCSRKLVGITGQSNRMKIGPGTF